METLSDEITDLQKLLDQSHVEIHELIQALAKAVDKLVRQAEQILPLFRVDDPTSKIVANLIADGASLKKAVLKSRNPISEQLGILSLQLYEKDQEIDSCNETIQKFEAALKRAVEVEMELRKAKNHETEQKKKLEEAVAKQNILKKEADPTSVNFQKMINRMNALEIGYNALKEDHDALKEDYNVKIGLLIEKGEEIDSLKQQIQETTNRGIIGDVAIQAQSLLWWLLYPEDFRPGKRSPGLNTMRNLAYSSSNEDQERLRESGLSKEQLKQTVDAIKMLKNLRYIEYHPGKNLTHNPSDSDIKKIAVKNSCYDQVCWLWDFGKNLLQDCSILDSESQWKFKGKTQIQKFLSDSKRKDP